MISNKTSSRKRLIKDGESSSVRKIHVSQTFQNEKRLQPFLHEEEDGHTEPKRLELNHSSDTQKENDVKKMAIQDEEAVKNMRNFKETEDLYKSNVFRLQMEEMLKEIQVPYSNLKGLENALKQLKSIIDTMEEITELSWLQAMEHIESESLKNKGDGNSLTTSCNKGICPDIIRIPWTLQGSEHASPIQYKFSFLKPHMMTIVGSYLLRTCTKPILNVDVAIEMPSQIFQPKDYLNHRYFHKRAFYLAKIAVALQRSKLFGSLSYQWFHGDRRRPILLVRSIATTNYIGRETTLDDVIFDKSHFVIRIIPCIHKETFKLSKLSPARQNLRDSYELKIPTKMKESRGKDEEEKKELCDTITRWPTPFYNNTLLSEMFHKEHLTLVHDALSQYPSAIDAILLLKTWLRQRSFNAMSGAFDGFLITMLIAYLIRHRKIVKHLSSYQIFRIVLQFIAQHDWLTTPLSFSNTFSPNDFKAKTEKEERNHEVDPQVMSIYRALFPIVFLDADGKLNLCANVSKTAMLEMQYEANLSLHMLNDASRDCFADLFLKSFDKRVRFDIICQVRIGHVEEAVAAAIAAAKATPSIEENLSEDMDNQIIAGLSHKLMDFGNTSICFIHWVSNLLKEALQDRIHWIHLEMILHDNDDNKKLDFNRQNEAGRTMALSMPHQEASQVCEILVGLCLNPEYAFRSVDHGPYANDTMAAKAFRKLWGNKAELRRFQDGSIRETLVWNLSSKNKLFIYREMLELLLKRHFMILPKKHILWPFSLSSKSLSHEIQEDTIMSLADINKAFYEFSKELRWLEGLPLTITSVQPARYYTHSELSFNDMYFFKQPFEIVIHFESTNQWPDDVNAIRVLKAAFYLCLAEKLQKTHGISVTPTFEFLDVSHSRYRMAFRLRIVHEREIHILREKERSMKRIAERLERDLIHRPRLVSRLHSLAAQYPAFNGVLQLAHDWFDGHFFSSYIPIEVVDLLVAHLFLNPYPYAEPASDITGFYRWIQLLATQHWHTTPLILNFNQTLTTDDLTRILEHFMKLRDLTRHHSRMYIATSDDPEARHWTLKMPNQPFLSRLVHYAQKTFDAIQNQANQGIPLDVRALCVTPLDGYDVLIHLNAIEEISPQWAIGFDPMLHFARELRQIFGEYALFLCNPSKISVIAILWKPMTKLDRPLKVKHHFLSMPSSDGENIRVDCANILHIIEILGGDLIREIVILKEFDS